MHHSMSSRRNSMNPYFEKFNGNASRCDMMLINAKFLFNNHMKRITGMFENISDILRYVDLIWKKSGNADRQSFSMLFVEVLMIPKRKQNEILNKYMECRPLKGSYRKAEKCRKRSSGRIFGLRLLDIERIQVQYSHSSFRRKYFMHIGRSW